LAETKQTGGMSNEEEDRSLLPTEMGSASFAELGGQGSRYKYETGPSELKQGTKGPPWSIEPSMRFVCDEVGIDYNQFIADLRNNKGDQEMAAEFGVPEKTIQYLKERFYRLDVPVTGNYGQD
jgi:hypothetical protein